MLIISKDAEDALLSLDDSIHKWDVIVDTKQSVEPSQELIAPLRVVGK